VPAAELEPVADGVLALFGGSGREKHSPPRPPHQQRTVDVEHDIEVLAAPDECDWTSKIRR
jgi:hypothetical protein